MFKHSSLVSAPAAKAAWGWPTRSIVACCAVAALASGCASVPMGPTVAAMPPPGKSFEAFVQDDQFCRQWASANVGPNREAATNQFLGSAVAGAAIGAVAGALAGGHRDAGAGAAVGTVIGSGVGANQSAMTGWAGQRNYDVAYQQCMYTKGNVIPGYYPYPTPRVPPQPLR